MAEMGIELKDEADPIVVRLRSLIELLRYLTIFYIVYLSLFIPFFGLIVGYIMMKNGVLPETRKVGKAAFIIGIIEIILLVLFIIVYAVLIAAGLMAGLEGLQELESTYY
ncbi:MAG TPA: hypothetical protein ENI43_00340 [Firmicutes bacterium]|nr:hypothetical protein [Bacillota bacterium]